MDLDLENLTMTDTNCHLQLQSMSVENLMTWLDLQILVKGCANTSYEARIFTQKKFSKKRCQKASKMLVFTISSAKFYQRFIKSSYLIVCCETQYRTSEQSIYFSITRKAQINSCLSRNLGF